MADTFQDFVMNVDILNAQFDAELLFEEAKKLGMDLGDFKDYAYDKS